VRLAVDPSNGSRAGWGESKMFDRLARVLADAVQTVDARLPVAVNKRTGVAFGASLGPHSETETFKLIIDEARATDRAWFIDAVLGSATRHSFAI